MTKKEAFLFIVFLVSRGKFISPCYKVVNIEEERFYKKLLDCLEKHNLAKSRIVNHLSSMFVI